MQSTPTRGSQSASYSAGHVWNLDSVAQRRVTPRRRRRRTAPIAAALGLAALCSALLPAAMIETRTLFTICVGIIAACAGFSTLRRPQTRMTFLLAVVGVTAPAVAIASVVLQIAQEPATVTSATVQRMTLQPDSSELVSTRDFTMLPAAERATMKAFLSASVLQLQTMHGSSAPFPHSLAISSGVLVEGDGIFRGTSLGALPQGERLDYQIASDGSAIRIAISSSSDPRAMIWADRGLQMSPNS